MDVGSCTHYSELSTHHNDSRNVPFRTLGRLRWKAVNERHEVSPPGRKEHLGIKGQLHAYTLANR